MPAERCHGRNSIPVTPASHPATTHPVRDGTWLEFASGESSSGLAKALGTTPHFWLNSQLAM